MTKEMVQAHATPPNTGINGVCLHSYLVRRLRFLADFIDKTEFTNGEIMKASNCITKEFQPLLGIK